MELEWLAQFERQRLRITRIRLNAAQLAELERITGQSQYCYGYEVAHAPELARDLES